MAGYPIYGHPYHMTAGGGMIMMASGGMHPRGLHLQMHPWQQPNLYWQQGQPRAASWQQGQPRATSSQRPSRPDANVAASSVRVPAAAKAPSVRAAPPKGPPDVLSKAVQTADELYTPAPRSLKMLALGDTPSPVKDMATSPIIWSKTPLPPSPSWTDSTRDSADRGARCSTSPASTGGVLSSAVTPDKIEDQGILKASRLPKPSIFTPPSKGASCRADADAASSSAGDESAQRPPPVREDPDKVVTSHLSKENLMAHVRVLGGGDGKKDAVAGFVTPVQRRVQGASPSQISTGGGYGKAMCGVGITFGRDAMGRMTVYRIQKGGGADLCGGVHVGDILVEIDGEEVVGMDPAAMAPLLVGVEGSRALLGVRRHPSLQTLLRFYIVRCRPRAAHVALHHITRESPKQGEVAM